MSRQSRLLVTAAACAAGMLAIADNARAQMYVIFAPGTDQAYMDQVNAEVDARNQRLGVDRYVIKHRWPGTTGDPLNITWSLVPDGTGPIPAKPGTADVAAASELFNRFNTKFEGNDALWMQLISDTFQAAVADPDFRMLGNYHDWGNISGLTCSQVTRPPDLTDPENPIYFDSDSGATWDNVNGSANGPLAPGGGFGFDPDVGDIRIAARRMDGTGGITGYAYGPDDPMYPGEIVLDWDEAWADSAFQFRYFRNLFGHYVGLALGLDVACPEDNSRLMQRPETLTAAFTGPQLDDIRGIQALYGDYLENDDNPDSAVPIQVDLTTSLFGYSFVHDYRSLDTSSDLDYYRLQVPDLGGETNLDLEVRVTPIGKSYKSGPLINGGCGYDESMLDDVEALAIRNLRISLLDTNLQVVDVYSANSQGGPPLPREAGGWVNESDYGNPESFFVKLTAAGDYFIIIGGAPGGSHPDWPQLYSISISLGNKIFNDGIHFNDLVLSDAPAGMGIGRIIDVPQGTAPEGQGVYRGSRARVGITEDHWPSVGHDATKYLAGPPPLPSQDFPPQRISFPGNADSPAALTGVSQHATAAISAAIGNNLGTETSGFIGAAFEAPWLAASIGIRNVGSSFTVSREALLYGLFGLTDPDTALSIGLPATATVLTNSWGSAGDLRGDSYIAQAFDAVVFMTGVPAVVSAGNDGDADNSAQCGGTGGNSPGGEFRGARTLSSPSTSFNTISVGMCGKNFDIKDDPVPPLPEFVHASTDPYVLVTDHSSKGPADSFNWEDGTTQFNRRPGIDLVSIGNGYVIRGEDPLEMEPVPGDPCGYKGHQTIIPISLPTINSSEADPDNPQDPLAFASWTGTSFSAPAVAGAVALLQDYALAQNPPVKLHPAAIRAILLTSARQFQGWSNSGNPARPQDNRDGRKIEEDPTVVERQTVQALDYAQGAGFCDAYRAFEVLRGIYNNPDLANMLSGPPTTDVAITDPETPTICTPPNEIRLIRPIPRSASTVSAPEYESVEDLPKSPIEIADLISRSREGLPDEMIFRPLSDFGDPDIGRVGGEKSADGIQFDDRVPFKLPPSPNRPGIPPSIPPVEIPADERIVVNPIGWDVGNLGERTLRMPASGNFQGGGVPAGYIDYFIAYAFDGDGDYISATLCWNREVEMDYPDFTNIDNPRIGEIERLELDNLDLELIQCDALGNIIGDHLFLGNIGEDEGGPVWASSRTTYNTVEHIYTRTTDLGPEDDDDIAPPGFYVLRVRWVNGNGFTGQEYDLFNNSPPAATPYGLAWRVEPSGGSDPDPDTPGARAVGASNAHGMPSQRLRVFQMFVSAFGKTSQDPGFNPAFDVNRDGVVDIYDFTPIYNFWFTR